MDFAISVLHFLWRYDFLKRTIVFLENLEKSEKWSLVEVERFPNREEKTKDEIFLTFSFSDVDNQKIM